MSLALAGSATSFATTVLSYFSPSKSPFYSVVAFGTIALVLSCEKIDKVDFLAVFTPIFLVLALSAFLSFKNRPDFEEGQGEEQLRFARSFSISSALLSFVLTARAVDENILIFWINYIACLSQIVTFLMYTWARSQTPEEQTRINFVQFALITATFLIGASYSSIEYVSSLVLKEGETEIPAYAGRYFLVAVSLYFLWFCCLIYWLKHLSTLIRIEIPDQRSQSN